MPKTFLPIVVVAAAACLNLAAIAQPSSLHKAPATLQAQRCSAAICTIHVSVDSCQEAGGVRLDKPLVVTDDAVLLVWTIDKPGHVFAAGGVRVEADEAEFEAQPAETPNEIRLRNRNSIMGEFDYRYTLQVEGCKPVQGWIRNVAI